MSSLSFSLPLELSAKEPPERRGIARDQVRLMIIDRANYQVEHTRFDHLGEYVRPGDLLVFNTSRTLPAALDCELPAGPCMEIRLAQHLPDDSWLALLFVKGATFLLWSSVCRLTLVRLTGTVYDHDQNIPRLWKLLLEIGNRAHRSALPSRTTNRYEYVSAPWDLDYQTVYAKEPGSAEMPSAGRAFTWKLL